MNKESPLVVLAVLLLTRFLVCENWFLQSLLSGTFLPSSLFSSKIQSSNFFFCGGVYTSPIVLGEILAFPVVEWTVSSLFWYLSLSGSFVHLAL